MSRHLIRHQPTAVIVGGVLVVAGALVLYDAWDGRGKRTPWFLRWAFPW